MAILLILPEEAKADERIALAEYDRFLEQPALVGADFIELAQRSRQRFSYPAPAGLSSRPQNPCPQTSVGFEFQAAF